MELHANYRSSYSHRLIKEMVETDTERNREGKMKVSRPAHGCIAALAFTLKHERSSLSFPFIHEKEIF